MLDVARRRLDASELTNVEFRQADAQTERFPEGFDVAISRFGTMFFGDPVAAFTNIATWLHGDGRACFATWQPLTANDWLTIPAAALLRYGTVPDAVLSGPGMFAQSDPDTVTSVLASAGFHSIDLTPVRLANVLGADAVAATDYLASSGIGRAVLETIPDDRLDEALDAVRAALDEHATDDGVALDAAIWIIHAE
jgi:SAM-dependent methyltransferase